MAGDMELLHRLAYPALPVLLDAAAKGLVLLGVAGGLVLAMRKASAAARHLVWLLTLAVLMVLPLASAMLPSWGILPEWVKFEMAAESATRPSESIVSTGHAQATEPFRGRGRGADQMDTPALAPNQTYTPAPTPSSPSEYATAPSIVPPPTVALKTKQQASLTANATLAAMAIWLVGGLVCLLPSILGRISLWRLSKRSRQITGGSWVTLSQHAAQAIGLRRSIRLLQSRDETMPMVWGIWRPKLLLPAEAEDWTVERRWVVLLHELAHAKRRDCLTKLIAHVACSFYWFNPLCWIAFKQMQREAEVACDDLVLASGGLAGTDASGSLSVRPSDYAQHLLEIASGLKSGMLTAYSSIAMARKSKLEGRLLAILDPRRNRRGMTRLGILITAALVTAVAIPLATIKATGPSTDDNRDSTTSNLNGSYKLEGRATYHRGESVEVRLQGIHNDKWKLDEKALDANKPEAYWRLDGRDIPAGMSLFGGSTNELVSADMSEGTHTLQYVLKRLPLIGRDKAENRVVFDEVTSNIVKFVVLGRRDASSMRYEFGPTMEMKVTRGEYVNLASARKLNSAIVSTKPSTGPQLNRWLADHNVDLFYDSFLTPNHWLRVAMADALVSFVPGDVGDGNSLSADQVADALSIGQAVSSHFIAQYEGKPPDSKSWRRPIRFKTRDGRMGLLQIVEMAEDGTSVQLRYKLIQPRVATTQPATQPADTTAIQDTLRMLSLPWQERISPEIIDQAAASLRAMPDDAVARIMSDFSGAHKNDFSFQHRAVQVLERLATDKAKASLVDIALGRTAANLPSMKQWAASSYIRTLTDKTEARVLISSNDSGVLNSALLAIQGIRVDQSLMEQLRAVLARKNDAPTTRVMLLRCVALVMAADPGSDFAKEKAVAILTATAGASDMPDADKYPGQLSGVRLTFSEIQQADGVRCLSRMNGADAPLREAVGQVAGLTRDIACIALANRGDTSMRREMLRILQDSSAGMLRKLAAEGMGVVGTRDDVAFLKKLSESDPFERESVSDVMPFSHQVFPVREAARRAADKLSNTQATQPATQPAEAERGKVVEFTIEYPEKPEGGEEPFNRIYYDLDAGKHHQLPANAATESGPKKQVYDAGVDLFVMRLQGGMYLLQHIGMTYWSVKDDKWDVDATAMRELIQHGKPVPNEDVTGWPSIAQHDRVWAFHTSRGNIGVIQFLDNIGGKGPLRTRGYRFRYKLLGQPTTLPVDSKLEYRIAPKASDLGKEDLASYMDWLKIGKVGPWGQKELDWVGPLPRYMWLPISGELTNMPQLITGEYDGQKYVLVSDKPGQTMTPGEGKDAWGLTKVYATKDDQNRPVVSFELDDRGAERFTALTKANINNTLAIVIDGKVVSAPIIMTALGKTGIIPGRFSEQQVADLVQALRAGMPPATQPATQPVAESDEKFLEGVAKKLAEATGRQWTLKDKPRERGLTLSAEFTRPQPNPVFTVYMIYPKPWTAEAKARWNSALAALAYIPIASSDRCTLLLTGDEDKEVSRKIISTLGLSHLRSIEDAWPATQPMRIQAWRDDESQQYIGMADEELVKRIGTAQWHANAVPFDKRFVDKDELFRDASPRVRQMAGVVGHFYNKLRTDAVLVIRKRLGEKGVFDAYWAKPGQEGLAFFNPPPKIQTTSPATQPAENAETLDQARQLMQQVRIVDDPESAIRAALPTEKHSHLVIQRVEKVSSPWGREAGKGTAFYIGRPLEDLPRLPDGSVDHSRIKQEYRLVLWIMPPDYQGRLLPRVQPSPVGRADLILSVENGKVYSSYGSTDEALALLDVIAPLPNELIQQRDALLTEANRIIVQKLIELANEFPQLKQSARFNDLSRSTGKGQIGVWLPNPTRGGKAGAATAQRPEDAFGITVYLRPARMEISQMVTHGLLPNLRLAGQIGSSAADTKLDAALKKIIDDALQPLRQLNDTIGR